jgi:hypothetical protein
MKTQVQRMVVSLLALISASMVPGLAPLLSAAQVVLTWSANTESDLAGYKVYYGTSSRNYGPAINAGNLTSYTLTGLNSGIYFFAITAYDTSGNESAFSSEASRTIAPDTIPPVLSGIQGTGIGGTFATIVWASNEPSDTQVEYGTTSSYGNSTSLNATLTTAHSQVVTGLSQNTLYNYRVRSRDGAGNLSVSGNFSFTTTDSTVISGLVNAYSFDEGAGSVTSDASGSGNTGALANAPVWTSQGKYGSALSFDGVDDFVSVADNATLDLTSGGTMEAWVKLDTLDRWHGVIAKGDANTDAVHNFALEINNANAVRCILGDGSAYQQLDSSTTMTTGQFRHLACSWDGATVRLYIDGVLNASAAQSLTPAGNTAPLYVGQFGGNSDRLDGTIDDVRLYNRALTASEIQADMNTPIGAAPPAVSRCDCSGDGLTNAVDVQVLVNAILAGNNASSNDVNRNGTVDVLDLQLLGNVVLGVTVCP